MPILGIMASSRPAFELVGSYDSLATVTVGATSVASIEFAGIPSGYKHLQIRGIARTANAVTYGGLRLQVGNGSADTASNYSTHDLTGDGATATAGATANNTNIFIGSIASASLASNIFGTSVIDILDYADTNKYKTVRTLAGVDGNGSGFSRLFSGSWRSTSAINTIKIFSTSGNFVQYSSFALYGIK
jgi:hypothetical protein